MDIKEVHDAIHILYTNGTSKDLIKRAINNIFNRSFPASVPTIADILIDEKEYPLALEYCNLALKSIHIDELYCTLYTIYCDILQFRPQYIVETHN